MYHQYDSAKNRRWAKLQSPARKRYEKAERERAGFTPPVIFAKRARAYNEFRNNAISSLVGFSGN